MKKDDKEGNDLLKKWVRTDYTRIFWVSQLRLPCHVSVHVFAFGRKNTMRLWKKEGENQLLCFIHEVQSLKKGTSKAGWECLYGIKKDSPVFEGLNRAQGYLSSGRDRSLLPSISHDMAIKGVLKCQCEESMKLCMSKSISNPDRLFPRCQRNQCFILCLTSERWWASFLAWWLSM